MIEVFVIDLLSVDGPHPFLIKKGLLSFSRDVKAYHCLSYKIHIRSAFGQKDKLEKLDSLKL